MMEKYFERHALPSRPELGPRIRELVELTGEAQSANAELYEQMLRTLVHFIAQSPDRWDTKILNHTIREMTSAFSRLRPYRRRRKVTVFGSARTAATDPDYQLAKHLGELLAHDDYMVITGAGPGIMQAAHEGAGRDWSIGLNIALPYEQGANPIIKGDDKLINFRFFFTRKLFFVKEADAVVLLPGGFGTQDESYELLTLIQTGKSPVVPIVLLDSPTSNYWDGWLKFVHERLEAPARISDSDRALFRHVHTAEEAIEEIRQFYRNFHSVRSVGDWLMVRLWNAPTPELLARLQVDFADLLVSGEFEVQPPHPDELDEEELSQLPRLAFRFINRKFGRFRQLIDTLNEFGGPETRP